MRCPTPTMFLVPFLVASMATLACAQSTMTLSQALSDQNSTLSMLNSLLAGQPTLVAALSGLNGITILAPTNDALSRFLSTDTGKAAATQPDKIAALLQYHVLNGTFPASSFTNTSQFLPTLLKNTSYTGVTGGQVVNAMLQGNMVEIFSGLKQKSTVTKADIMFNGGVIHEIDTVLTIPYSIRRTALDGGLSALDGAITIAKLTAAVDKARDLTIFAPSNAAFQAIGSITPNLTAPQISSLLRYHIISGSVAYSPFLVTLANESFPTAQGGRVHLSAESGKIFVNAAHITITDLIVANGVMHVLDNVLNPSNTTVLPNPAAATQAVAYSGAFAAATVPFAAAVVATTTVAAATSTGAAAARQTGGMAIAALFGGAALLGNL